MDKTFAFLQDHSKTMGPLNYCN